MVTGTLEDQAGQERVRTTARRGTPLLERDPEIVGAVLWHPSQRHAYEVIGGLLA